MPQDMKTIVMTKRSKYRTLHVEAPGCIINIRIGLTRDDGCEVTRIDVSADGERYAGEPPAWIETYGSDPQFANKSGTSVMVVRAAQ